MIKRTSKRSLVALGVLALGAWLIEPGASRMPAGILAGGGLGLLNLRGIERGVRNFLSTHAAKWKLFFYGTFRLFLLGIIILLIAKLKLVNLIGLMIGFSVVLFVLLIEALREVRIMMEKESR